MDVSTEPVRGEVTRDDVAAVLEAVLHEPRTRHLKLYVRGGEDPVERAVAALI